ncbi:MAG TPA: PmoA family protein [Planctomycetota bacterium]|nr:PmoA family protein [Planctomycetota bacterium]
MKALAALLLIVSSGDHDRLDTPVSVALRLADVGLTAEQAGKATFLLWEQGVKEKTVIPAQWDASGEGCLVFILPGKTPKGATRTFELQVKTNEQAPAAATSKVTEGKCVDVAVGGKPVFRYNHGVVPQFQDKPSKYDRAGYFHPLWAPCGEIVTGDFHPDHAHHRGVWFAWVKADAGPVKANFWEIQEGRGKFVNKALAPVAGPVFAGFAAQNDLVSGDKAILKEGIAARAYAAPRDVRLIDLTVRHEATDADVVLGKLHYGGLGFRGRDEWNEKGAALDVLTSAGKTRKDANATKAKWIDFTGRLGTEGWGGLLAIEHPSNPRYPNGVRVHPSMAFFSTTLVQPEPYTIKKGEPLVLRYRLVIHDGKPDKALAERLAADFTTPPTVTLRREQ